jgi:hypothetical protein
VSACTATPISWPRLEAHAAGARDAAIETHVAECAACRACLATITDDVVALPALVVAEPELRRSWWRNWIMPATAAAALAIALLVIVRPSPEPEREDVVRVKGVGEVIVDVVRKRGTLVTPGARTFARGDQWKLVVTCPPDKGAWIEVVVEEVGTGEIAHPLAPARVGCGNGVVVPGALELVGPRPNRVCARIDADEPPVVTADRACVTIRPE